ncbi:MAG TPA: hypothetical protein VMF60_11015 [Acidimicrobiales bacterium]|nr:hypothetical protein [Acidimicrobiales bacterium]
MAVRGDLSSTVFVVDAAVTDATISGITIEEGEGTPGGGIENDGTLTVRNTVVSNNTNATCAGGCAAARGAASPTTAR